MCEANEKDAGLSDGVLGAVGGGGHGVKDEEGVGGGGERGDGGDVCGGRGDGGGGAAAKDVAEERRAAHVRPHALVDAPQREQRGCVLSVCRRRTRAVTHPFLLMCFFVQTKKEKGKKRTPKEGSCENGL